MEAEKWMEKAWKDLDDAEFTLKNKRFELSAFLPHRAAEKALKALYVLKFKRLWKIHDLRELGRRIGAPARIIRICDSLNPHYIETRYPVEVVYTKDMAKEAFETLKR